MNIFIISLVAFFFSGQNYDVLMPDGSKDFPPNNKALFKFGKSNDFVYVVDDAVKPLKEPKLDSGFSGAPGIKFGDTFKVVEIQQAGKATFWCICKEDNNNKRDIWGWLPDQAVLASDNALLIQGSNISRKAVVINSVEWFKKNGIKPPTPLLGFSENSEKTISDRLFNLMFVFKERRDKSGHYVLLSYDPTITDSRVVTKVLKGWYPIETLCLWNTREAVQWKYSNYNNPRLNSGLVFKTKEGAKNYCSSFKCNDPPNMNKPEGLIAEEIIDKERKKSAEWDIDQLRYPILSLKHEEENLGNGFGAVYKIGVIGNFAKANGEFVSQKDLEKARSQVNSIKTEMDNTYILFVIDDTSSMEEAFQKTVPDFIKNIIATVPHQLGKVHVAVCFYNDFKTNAAKNQAGAKLADTCSFIPWENLSKGNDSNIIKTLVNHTAKDGGDSLEQPINGLLYGLKKASYGLPRWSRKVVFVIGDMGNHTEKNLKQDLAADSNDIAKLLCPDGPAWEFLPIQVPHPKGGDAANNDPDYKLFVTQMNKINELRRKLRKTNIEKMEQSPLKQTVIADLEKDTVNTISVGDYKEILKDLEKRSQDFKDKKEKIEKEMLSVVRGSFPSGSQFSAEVSLAFAKESVNIDILKDSGSQLFEEGWVTEKDGCENDQIQVMLLMEKPAFDGIRELLSKINDSKNDPKFINDLTGGIAGGQAGEKFKDIQEALKSLGQQPFQSQLLKFFKDKELANIKGFALKTDVVVSNLKRINKINLIYIDLLDNKFSNYVEEGYTELAGGGKVPNWVKKGETIDKKRFFILRGSNEKDVGNNFIWLDFKEEYP